MIKICKHCGEKFETQANGTSRQYCYNCNPIGETLSGNTLRKKMKMWALEYKGDRCEKCGYNKSISALEFHHLDPAEKDFSISSSTLSNNWEKIKKELDKCIVLCSNCHRELHEKIKEDELKFNLSQKRVHNARRVRCINTGEIFGSCEIAGSVYCINSPKHIKDVCNGERSHCGQHPNTQESLIWEWVDEETDRLNELSDKRTQLLIKIKASEKERIEKMRQANSTQVVCSTGEYFNSLKEASAWCKITPQSIGRALKNENFTAGQHPITKEKLHWYKIDKESDDIDSTKK